MIKLVWRYLLAPPLYPIISLPMALILFVARPLQLAVILITTGLFQIHPWVAVAFTTVFVALYAYNVFVPPRTRTTATAWWRTYDGGQASLASFTHTLVFVVGFLVGFWLLPFSHPIVRWFAAFGLGYYASGVASSYVTLVTYGPQMREWDKLTRG